VRVSKPFCVLDDCAQPAAETGGEKESFDVNDAASHAAERSADTG